MVGIAGGIIWVVVVIYAGVCFHLFERPFVFSRQRMTVLSLGILGSLIVLIRPDEEIEAGEDPGAYFNAAMAFVQHDALRFPDPALKELDAKDRPLFRYGNASFMVTKDHSLWAQSIAMDEVGVFFFPAYSLMMGVPMVLGMPYLALLISPLTALLVGWLLAVLVRWLTGVNWSRQVVFALFVLNPAVVWNARCIRAEWLASFCMLAGLVLWLAQVGMGRTLPRTVAWLAGFAAASAAFFHITAWYVILPLMVIGLWMTRRTAFWAFWWAGLGCGLGLFAAELVWITDPYWILDNLLAPSRRLFVGLAVIGLMVGIPLVRIAWQKVACRWLVNDRLECVAGAAISIAYVLLIVIITRIRDEQGLIPGLPAWSAAYISLTDFEGVRRLMSNFFAISALLGLVSCCVHTGRAGRVGRLLFMLLAPASLTIGWVDNYMFETRRMVTFLAPLAVLSTTVLFFDIGKRLSRKTLQMSMVGLLTVLILGAYVHGRTALYTTWNNNGLYRFYKKNAERVQSEGDYLLAEYTQTAVPVGRFSQLPLLPISWEYRSEGEYLAAQTIMADLVNNHPERRYILVSPFADAVIPGTQCEPMFDKTLYTRRVNRARRSVPTGVSPMSQTLYFSRILPAGSQTNFTTYSREINGGKLGLKGYANLFANRTMELNGVAIASEKSVSIPIMLSVADSQTLLFIFAVPDPSSSNNLHIHDEKGQALDCRRYDLIPGWKVLEWNHPTEQTVIVTSTETVYLTQLIRLDNAGEMHHLGLPEKQTAFTIPSVDFQWFTSSASVAVPAGDTRRWLWMLAGSGRDESPEITVKLAGSDQATPFIMMPDWMWYISPLKINSTNVSSFSWVDISTSPAWDPNMRNFPSNLGFLMRGVVSMPIQE